MLRTSLTLVGLLATSCGGASTAATDGGDPGDAGLDAGSELSGDAAAVEDAADASNGDVAAADRPALPQVISYGGLVLTSPKVQPIAYAADEGLPQMNAFLQELTTTSFWSQATAEYQVGPLTILPTIVLADAPPQSLSDHELASTLAANTTGAEPPWGPTDPSTIYLFLLPRGTLESDSGGTCCSDYDAYHSETVSGSVSVPYAVSCTCHGFDGAGISDVQERTVNVSHELVESATDPLPYSNPAFGREDDADVVWTLATVGEVADMCEFNNDAYYVPPGATYMVQRTWSNEAARQFVNPCVPHLVTAPYFNSIPKLDLVPYALQGGGVVMTRGIQMAIGQTRTVDVNLYSGAPAPGPWRITAYDYGSLVGGASNLVLSLDSRTGQSGDTVHLTVKAVSANSTIGGEAFVLYSEYGQIGKPGYQNNLSMGLVVN